MPCGVFKDRMDISENSCSLVARNKTNEFSWTTKGHASNTYIISKSKEYTLCKEEKGRVRDVTHCHTHLGYIYKNTPLSRVTCHAPPLTIAKEPFCKFTIFFFIVYFANPKDTSFYFHKHIPTFEKAITGWLQTSRLLPAGTLKMLKKYLYIIL